MGKQGALPMIGGYGDNSYLRNSSYQRKMFEIIKHIIDDAIQTKLDLSAVSGALRIADLGCAVGPNTFYAVQSIIDAVMAAINKSPNHQNQSLDVQVFFNDQVGNDFNLLLSTLPADHRYFAAAVPGSFYSRLFPRDSVHFFISAMSLLWLSKAPEGVVNKGRIHTYGGGPAVRNAYLAQFMADMDVFLKSRAEEIIVGGLVAVLIPCCESSLPSLSLEEFYGTILDPMFHELVLQGKVKEEDVDAFQMPAFTPTIEEFKEVVEINGHFTIHVTEVVEWFNVGGHDGALPDLEQWAWSIATTYRAAHEEVLKYHFGENIVVQLFEMVPRQIQRYFATHNPRHMFPPAALFILQLKA